jgi:hypothetical protein
VRDPTLLGECLQVISELPREPRHRMTTLFEQSLSILLDSFVLEIMKRTGETGESMTKRHNVIE